MFQLSHFQLTDGRKLFGGYKITPKFCTDSKTSKADTKVHGPAICMFNHECVERRGLVIGACMDGWVSADFSCSRFPLMLVSRHFSFLFGTCCLLSGEIETSLANVKSNITQSSSEKVSTKEPVYMSSKPQVINNQFYGASVDDDNSLYDDTKFEVMNEAVVVSSPAYGEKVASSFYPTEATPKITQHVSSHSYSTEFPTRIYSSTASSSEESNESSNSIQFSKVPYDHSDISYSPSDAEILMDDGNNLASRYPSSTSGTLFSETRTEAPERNKFSKPIFKLKPTQYPSSTEKYVLVHTISNDKQSEAAQENPTKKPSTNESIQSIILMLNGSNPGPEYNVDSIGMNHNYGSPSTPSYGSTSMINREQYGSSSYYITTKVPTTVKVPSTSYVYTPNPTRRQTSKTTTKNVSRLKITPTKSPLTTTTPNIPSTSYVYSPNPIKKRPTTALPSSTTAIKKGTTSAIKKTTPRPSIIVKQPSPDVQSNYVVISGGGITKHQSPTVHITPKPIVNILTSSTLEQVNDKKPAPTQASSVTERLPFVSTTPTAFISTSIYVPAIQDFHNEGYFVVTHRPGAGATSTSVYTIANGILSERPSTGSHVKIPVSEHDPVNFNDETPVMHNDDFSNFPPVRNPNLNMSASNTVLDESEISTPAFVEDEQLNSKIDLLVNKLVASMQGNLDNLIDIVYERKNVSTAEQDISNLHKNGTILQDAKPTKVSKPPGNVKVTTAKAPTKVTTGRPSQTTKKSPTKATPSTKKPSSTGTKKPASVGQPTKRPPNRTPSTAATKKPTKKVTTSTTERAPAEDELIEEEGEETAEETVEESEDDNVVEESEGDSTPPPLENGRIRKRSALFSLIKYTRQCDVTRTI